MNKEEIIDLHEKILKGLRLSFERLVKEKQKNNGILVFSKDDKIIFIKAKDYHLDSIS